MQRHTQLYGRRHIRRPKKRKPAYLQRWRSSLADPKPQPNRKMKRGAWVERRKAVHS